MPQEKHIYQQLLQSSVPKKVLHGIIHKTLMQEIKSVQQEQPSSTQHKRLAAFFQCIKNFNLKKRLKGKALCLLRTQYAKKPKNPV
jgi:hypothetical protein